MNKVMISVYDSKGEFYSNPICCKSKGEAVRSFEDEVNDPKSPIFKHPEDYTLFAIGEFDDSNCCFAMYESKVSLGLAVEFKRE